MIEVVVVVSIIDGCSKEGFFFFLSSASALIEVAEVAIFRFRKSLTATTEFTSLGTLSDI